MYPDTCREQIYDALCKYVFEGIEPEFDPMNAISTAVRFILNDIKSDKDHYANVCAKRSEAGKRHTGNQYTRGTNGTNGTNVPTMEQMEQMEQMPENMIMNRNIEEKEKQKDKSFSFSQKKEKIIFDFSLILLSEGRPNAYKEACDAYEFNESTGWTTETTKPNGDVTKKKITNPLSWLQGWKRSNEQLFAPADGMLFADIIRKIAEKKVQSENGEGLRIFENVINHFRGFRNEGDDVAMLFINRNTLLNFRKYVEGDECSKQILFSKLQKQFPKAQTLYYKVY